MARQDTIQDDPAEVVMQRGSRPIPDPTTLTTQQLQREVRMLKELIESRLDGYDKAITLLQARADKSPSIDVVDQNVTSLGRVVNERFESIQTQFRERDTRTEQTSKDSKVAVDAALQAAKEAVGEQNKSSALAIAKSDASMTKQIDQIGLLINASVAGINDKIDDLKTRVTTVESHSKGTTDFFGYVVGFFGLLIALGAIVVQVMKH